MSIFAETLKSGLDELDLQLDSGVLAGLELHWRLVEKCNQTFNLTAIHDEAEAALKHYLDCLLLLPQLRVMIAEQQQLWRLATMDGQSLEEEEQPPAPMLYAVDIGSGAGYPGLVLALACPEIYWFLLESNSKKHSFLLMCISLLCIKNARALPWRAEVAGRQNFMREKLDLVTARAVAGLPVLLEYALPLLREGGTFIAAKGPALPVEEAAAAKALAVLGAEPSAKQEFTLPGGEQRMIACYSKRAPTPDKYPRRAGMPEKRPL